MNIVPDSMHCVMRTIEKMLTILVQEGSDNTLKQASIKNREKYMDGVNIELKKIHGDSYSGKISYKDGKGEIEAVHFSNSEKARFLLGEYVGRLLLFIVCLISFSCINI